MKKLFVVFIIVSLISEADYFIKAISQYLSLFEGIPLKQRFAADFFYFIAFAKEAFVSSRPYFDSIPLLFEYFNIDFEFDMFRFPYPPNIILLIGHLGFIEKFFGLKITIISVFVINFLVCAISAKLLEKISKINFWLILALLLGSSFSSVVITSGQLSFIFCLILSLFIYFYLKNVLQEKQSQHRSQDQLHNHSENALFKVLDPKIFSGIMLSILMIKPQIAILLGVFALLEKRVLIGVIIGALISTLYTIMTCGIDIYKNYIESFVMGSSKGYLVFNERSVALPAILANNFHLNENLILIIYGVFALAVLLLFIFIHYKKSSLTIESKLGLMILLNFFITPYSLMYDLMICIPGILLLAKQFQGDKVFVTLSFLFLFASQSRLLAFMDYSSSFLFLSILIGYLINKSISKFFCR